MKREDVEAYLNGKVCFSPGSVELNLFLMELTGSWLAQDEELRVLKVKLNEYSDQWLATAVKYEKQVDETQTVRKKLHQQYEELTRLGGMYQEQLDLARHRAVANAALREKLAIAEEALESIASVMDGDYPSLDAEAAREALSKLRGGGK